MQKPSRATTVALAYAGATAIVVSAAESTGAGAELGRSRTTKAIWSAATHLVFVGP